MKSEVIYDTRKEGEPFEYVRVADRLPEFLKTYPPTRFAIESELSDLPRQADADNPVTVVKTTLTDLERGAVIATAHSCGRVTAAYKALEMLETASLQRLMSRLGFGGDVLATDELADFGMQGLQTAPTGSKAAPKADIPSPAEDEPAPSFAAVEVRPEDSVNTEELPVVEATEEKADDEGDTPEPVAAEPEAQAEDEVAGEADGEAQAEPEAEQVEETNPEEEDDAPVAESDDSGEEAPSPAPSKGTPKAKSKDAKAMDHYRRQIENIAKRKGIDPAPFLEYETKEEAQEILKKLFKGDVA